MRLDSIADRGRDIDDDPKQENGRASQGSVSGGSRVERQDSYRTTPRQNGQSEGEQVNASELASSESASTNAPDRRDASAPKQLPKLRVHRPFCSSPIIASADCFALLLGAEEAQALPLPLQSGPHVTKPPCLCL